ncbi:hypothetical protein B0T19DRAFT_441978 [Cercophora scortea]|uniref:Uncharacterized protein n=1 Tax=Cercophora scortea TaxID=314031 RepID=A0AAE0IN28_9PEZI|nr:hypothetical protein B0T19DRAFT_441978 [Cercophora scortea]
MAAITPNDAVPEEAANAQPNLDALTMFTTVQQRYTEEAAKRLRPDGLAQFLDIETASSDRIRAMGRDIWADHAALNAKPPAMTNGGRYKFLILGAGYGGLLYAARLIDAGLASKADDLRIVDIAGGFGGTWYWNRYPGLHCDVESYTYMPLLEETGYMPKSKYAPGPELREHADRIATQWGLHDKALFRSTVKTAKWDDEAQVWNVEIREDRGPNEPAWELQIQAQYFTVASGIITNPHMPKIPGIESFSGPMFHTSRWDYGVSGGSPEDLTLTGLRGKRVGIIGTGATAIQIIPQLAKWAKEVYVFQRTPSAVSWRGQKPTDPEEWKTKIANKKGWQRARMANINRAVNGSLREGEECVGPDGWTEIPSYDALIGSPRMARVEPTPEKIGEHIGQLLQSDLPHTERIRARVDAIVQDADTAAKLKAWYATWCKRPTFSDEYLQAFNLPHVHLIDTDGKGVEAATASGLVVGGREYPLDILVLGTGYRAIGTGDGSPAVRTGVDIIGRHGVSMDGKWQNHGAATLHGVLTNGFPNFFTNGPYQHGSAANYVYMLEPSVEHIVQIIAMAEARVGEGSRAVVEVTSAAEEAWCYEVMKGAGAYAGFAGCTPGYITSEGQKTTDPVEMMRKARLVPWSGGMESFVEVLEQYRAEGSLAGIDVTAVPLV